MISFHILLSILCNPIQEVTKQYATLTVFDTEGLSRLFVSISANQPGYKSRGG